MRPAYSMTGFARTSGRVHEQLSYSLSLKSVNHRFFDPHLRLPANCESLEMQLRALLKERVRRGHVEVTLQLERSARGGFQYDRNLVAAYVQAFREAAKEQGVPGEPDLNAVFRLPGVLAAEANSNADDMQALATDVLAKIDGPEGLIAQFNAMRGQEGAALVTELRACMGRLDAFAAEVAELRGSVRQAYFERMESRIHELLRVAGFDGGTGSSLDPQRILAEAALLAERSDVEEEVVRLRAHAAHFMLLLDEGGELGKKLDFLLQELNREANTLLSKTGGAASGNGLRITEIGLGMKEEIERAREQVQNLE